MKSRATIVPIVLYAILALIVVPVFPHFLSPNEISRWIVAVAIVDHHTVEVTRVVRDLNVHTEDLATVGGRLYSNKAPGGALVGLPGYAIVRAIVGPPSASTMRTTITAMRLLVSTIPVILLALWLMAVARRLGCKEESIRFAVVALLFGTPIFAYGLLLFAHALSALTLFGAFALLFKTEDRGPRAEDFGAGALIGLAVLSEYPNAIPAAVLLACALPRLRTGGLLRVIAGGAPFAAALGLYNYVAFGSAFTLSSAHEIDPKVRAVAAHGLFGVGLPSPANLFHLLLDPSKGLLVLSPILILSFAGIAAARRAMPRSAFIAILATPLSILLTFAGYTNWWGGWTVGARYLVAALPFLALLLALVEASYAGAVLLGASIAAIALVSLVFPFVPPDYPAPWMSFAWPLLRHGFVAPNLLHLVSRALAIAVPFAIAFAGLLIAAPKRHAVAAVAGAAIWIAAGVFAAAGQSEPPVIRMLVEAAYFENDGPVAPPLRPIVARIRTLPPPKWPF
ncbi:MAG TPA: hypothetical protein VLV78_00580 [Thermoanaerobaculia bacterium]|nr:hypothetical protein [Thermoanaerobaculia bacterium]